MGRRILMYHPMSFGSSRSGGERNEAIVEVAVFISQSFAGGGRTALSALTLLSLLLLTQDVYSQPNQTIVGGWLREEGYAGTQSTLKHDDGMDIAFWKPEKTDPGFVSVTGPVNPQSEEFRFYGTYRYNACASDSNRVVWSRLYPDGDSGNLAPSGHAESIAVGVDSSGNTYVTGWAYFGSVPDQNKDIVTIKYSTSGVRLWIRRLQMTGNQEPKAMVVEPDGKVYIAGWTTNAEFSTDTDLLTVAYDTTDSEEDEIWTQVLDVAGRAGEARAIAVHGDHVAVAGWQNSASNRDMIVIKYDKSDGDTVWSLGQSNLPYFIYNGYGNGHDQANAVAVGSGGIIYAAGKSYFSSARKEDYCVIKLTSSGELSTTWGTLTGAIEEPVVGARHYNGSGNDDDEILALCIDGLQRPVMTGRSDEGEGRMLDATTIVYSGNGDRATGWPQHFDSGVEKNEQGNDVAVDAMNNVYLAGFADTGPNVASLNYLIVKYRKSGGSPVGSLNLDPVGQLEDDMARAIAVEPDMQRAFVTGTVVYDTELGRQIGTKYVRSVDFLGDLNGDLIIDDTDLAILLEAFGTNCSGCPADLDENGTVDDTDLAILLEHFGFGCNP